MITAGIPLGSVGNPVVLIRRHSTVGPYDLDELADFIGQEKVYVRGDERAEFRRLNLSVPKFEYQVVRFKSRRTTSGFYDDTPLSFNVPWPARDLKAEFWKENGIERTRRAYYYFLGCASRRLHRKGMCGCIPFMDYKLPIVAEIDEWTAKLG